MRFSSCKLCKVEAVGVHHLVPGGDEVADELLLAVLAGIDLSIRTKLRVRAEDQINTRAGELRLAGLTIDAIKYLAVAVGRFPLRAHIEQVGEEIVGQRARAVGKDTVL